MPERERLDHEDELLAQEALADATEDRWEDAEVEVYPEEGDGP